MGDKDNRQWNWSDEFALLFHCFWVNDPPAATWLINLRSFEDVSKRERRGNGWRRSDLWGENNLCQYLRGRGQLQKNTASELEEETGEL